MLKQIDTILSPNIPSVRYVSTDKISLPSGEGAERKQLAVREADEGRRKAAVFNIQTSRLFALIAQTVRKFLKGIQGETFFKKVPKSNGK